MEALNVLERNIKIEHLVEELSKDININDLRNFSRQMQRKRQKNMEWYKALGADKKNFLDELGQAKFQSKLKEDRIHIVNLLDVSITAALILCTDFNLRDISKIGVQVGMNFGEALNFENEYGDEGMKKLADMEVEVRAYLTEIIKTEKDKAKCIRLAKDKFRGTGITTVHLANAYKTVKEAIEKAKEVTDALEVTLTAEAEEIENKLNYIFEEQKEKFEMKDTKKTKKVKEVKEVKEVQEVKEIQEENELKVINEVVIRDVQGRFGTYHIEKGAVTIDDKIFIDKASVVEIFSREREELIEKLNTLNSKETELVAVMENFR